MTTVSNTNSEGVDHTVVYPSDTKTISPKNYVSRVSGRVLNVMTQLPTHIYKVADENGDGLWDTEATRGNSALYSSHFFSEQYTEWENHLIAWSGELEYRNEFHTYMEFHQTQAELKEEDKIELEKKIRQASKTENVHPVWLDSKDQSRWREYAENVLWNVFHYVEVQFVSAKEEAKWWSDYVAFNEAYFEKIKSIYHKGDIIWIHDYYLLLLPQLIRTEFPDAIIGFTLHCPFPSSEYFSCLGKRTKLLDGILGADKVSFQCESFRRHFASTCERVLNYRIVNNVVHAYGSKILLEALPIGIDTQRIEHDAFLPSSGIDDKVKAIRELYPDKKIIVGRDRLDNVRGVLQKLRAFEMFLYMYPAWRNKVVLIQLSSPYYSRSRTYGKKVTELVNHINSEYGSINSFPVLHYHKRIRKDEYFALLRVADLALNTSVRDGVNATLLEYIICQKDNHSPLLVSEFSGTASVLRDALVVNPFDAVAVSKAILLLLTMPEKEKKEFSKKLYLQVISSNVQTWTNDFLKSLLLHVTTTYLAHNTPALNRNLLLKDYCNAKRRLFLLDYDGTLTPIVKEPSAAIPSLRLNNILDRLCAEPRNHVWIISGRDLAFLLRWFGHKRIGLSGEHGCFMKPVDSSHWHNLAEALDMSWQAKVEEVFLRYTRETPGSHIEKKKIALTWHYRQAKHNLGAVQSERCALELREKIQPHYEVEVMCGKANIEVRPSFVNKGSIVERLLGMPHHTNKLGDSDYELFGQEDHPDFVLCIGDDLTDEDMFTSLKQVDDSYSESHPRHFYSVVVGPASKATAAYAHLTEPAHVLEILDSLASNSIL